MKIKALIICLLLTTALYSKEAKTYGALYVKEVVKVIDGDTIKVNIAHIHPLIGEAIPVRLAGVDTPEMHDPDPAIRARALEAKAFTEHAVKNANKILLSNIRRGKYFRIVADVLLDGESLSTMLINASLGSPYSGGTKGIGP